MRNTVTKSWAVVLAALAGLAISGPATAGDGAPQLRGAWGSGKGLTYTNSHTSVLKVADNGQTPATKGVQLGENKSMLVEVPRELRDVIVSNPEIVDAVVQTSNRVYLIGKKAGQANAFFFDAHGEQVLTLEIMVDMDTAPLDSLLKRLLPGSSIKSEMLNNTVILTGTVRNPVDANRASDIASRFVVTTDPRGNERHEMKVINMLAVEGEEQVMLRVQFAEVQRSLLKQFGINIGAQINAGNFATSLLTSNQLPLTSAAGLGNLPIPGLGTGALEAGAAITCATSGVMCNYSDGPTADTFGNSGLSGGWSAGSSRVSHALRALERDGLIRTLAEPNLTAVSGETAKFLAGGEYPLPFVDSQGALSVRFKEFGVALAFTPVVMSEGRISLKIETEVSEITNVGSVTLSGIQIPALKKRTAKTTVELPSGGTMAIAGLMSDDVRQNIDGFPGLKDVPVLGTLFRSRDFIKQETELVVIVTPYTVRAVSHDKVARPDDGYASATDRQANFLGHINRVYGRGDPIPDGGLKGNYGFIVE